MARYHYSVQILGYSVTVSTKHFDCFSLGSNPSNPTRYMVIVAELVKHLIVVQAIVGSSPTLHTTTPRGRKSWSEIYSRKLDTLS